MSEIPPHLTADLADRYRIERELGVGGTATVYLAEDRKHRRKVAVKVLNPELSAAIGHERFLREITTTANLTHPHILPLYDSGEAGGHVFYVMPFAEGESLRDRLEREKQLPLDEAVLIAREVADALSYAHSRGVIHRDIKPENILLESGHAVVADFGIARAIDAAGGDRLTQTGLAIGTPTYMSPEQAAGDPDVDGRSDLYALACVLYEMLAGQPPFTARTVEALVRQHVLVDAPPVTNLRPAVPDAVAAALQRALAKAPADRFNPVAQFAEVLQQGAKAGPTAAAPRTQPGMVGIAVLPFADLSAQKDQEYFCEGMAEEIMNSLAQVGGLRVASRTSAFRAKQEGRDLQEVGRTLGVDQVLEGSVRTAGNRVRLTARLVDVGSGYQRWSERFDREMEDIFALQDDVASGVVRAITAELAPAKVQVRARPQVQNVEAYQLYLKGRHFRYSKNDHANALQCFEQALARDPSHGPSWLGLAEVKVLAAIYALQPSQASYVAANEALATASRLQGESAMGHYVAGMIALCERRYARSETELRRAIELDTEHVQAKCWLGMLLSALGRYQEVEGVLRHAREIDVLAAYPYAMTGVCLVLDAQFVESERFFEQALAFEPETSLALWGWATAKIALGHPDAAATLLERAAPSHRGGAIHGMLGWARASAGNLAEAGAVLTELRDRPAPTPANAAEAWLLGALGDVDAAYAVMEQLRAEQQGLLIFFRVPIFPALQGDARFAPYLESVGLEMATR